MYGKKCACVFCRRCMVRAFRKCLKVAEISNVWGKRGAHATIAHVSDAPASLEHPRTERQLLLFSLHPVCRQQHLLPQTTQLLVSLFPRHDSYPLVPSLSSGRYKLSTLFAFNAQRRRYNQPTEFVAFTIKLRYKYLHLVFQLDQRRRYKLPTLLALNAQR